VLGTPRFWFQRLHPADRDRFAEALQRAAAEQEGGSVHLTCAPAAGGRLRIKVADTGLGIPPESVERLFVSFERVESEHSASRGPAWACPCPSAWPRPWAAPWPWPAPQPGQHLLGLGRAASGRGPGPAARAPAAGGGLTGRGAGRARRPDPDRALQGARAFLTKPLDVRELLDAVAADREWAGRA
jgi:hypothetical protein